MILGKSQKTDRKLLVLHKKSSSCRREGYPGSPSPYPPILVRQSWVQPNLSIHFHGTHRVSVGIQMHPHKGPGRRGGSGYLQSCRIRRQFENEITPWGLLSVGRGWDLTFLGIDILAPQWLYDLQAASGSIPSARCVLTADRPVYMRLVIPHKLRKQAFLVRHFCFLSR